MLQESPEREPSVISRKLSSAWTCKARLNQTWLFCSPAPDVLESAMQKLRLVSSTLNKALAGARKWETVHAHCKLCSAVSGDTTINVPAPQPVPASSADVVIIESYEDSEPSSAAADHVNPAEDKREESGNGNSCKDVQAMRLISVMFLLTLHCIL